MRPYGGGRSADLSRAPHYHPNATSTQVVERIVEAKRRRPTWGPKKVVAWLRSIEDVPWPSPSTASGILDRAGLVRRRKRRRRATSWGEPFAHAQHPNDVWSIDLKGWSRTGDGMRIDPLTAQDAMSRYLLVCDGLVQPTGPEVKRHLDAPSGSTVFPGSSGPTTALRSPASDWVASRRCPHGGSTGDSAGADRAGTP